MPTQTLKAVKAKKSADKAAAKKDGEIELYAQVPSAQIRIPANMSVENLRVKLKAEKEEDIIYQSRRWGQWEENYLLFRDTVQINRLTQRQAINVPLIKETVKTVQAKIDETPTLSFQDYGGDADKEIAITEFWRDDADRNRIDLIDSVDKKQVILYGRSHTKHNLKNGRWTYEVKDIRDIVVDKKTKPHDLQTARHIEELNIWKPLAEIVINDRYDEVARKALLAQTGYLGETTGREDGAVIGNKQDAVDRDERLMGIGIPEALVDFNAYETMCQLTQHYTEIWDAEAKKYVRHVCLVADDTWILRAEPLKDAIGIDEWPIDTWADDLEATDYWSDGIIDSIRPINQTINIWVSQLVENRTLRNFGMNFYDDTATEGFSPDGYEPRAGGWYPLPGKPSEVYQNVEIQDLGSVMEDINFLVSLAEKASATGAIDKGVVEQGKRTLGEIEIAVSKAMERTTAMAKYYNYARKDMGNKWYSINAANVNDSQGIKLYKQNSSGVLKPITLKREQWVSEQGYKITVTSINDQVTERTDELIRLQAVKQFFPQNPPLDKAIKKRAVMIAKLTPEELTEIMDYEEQAAKEALEQQKREQAAMAITAAMGAGGPVPAAAAAQAVPEAAAATAVADAGLEEIAAQPEPAAA